MARRIDIPSLRAALWTQRALLQARYRLRRHSVEHVSVSPPPRLPSSAGRGVAALLRRRRHTCLERVLVLQRWEAAQGRPREIVIGVTGGSTNFTAHAWLDGDPDNDEQSYHELMRLPA